MSETNPLLNKQSVQGAAKHIEGLLDSKGVISKSQKDMEGFRRYIVDLYGNGSCTCRRLPNNRGGYEFRLWRTK